MKLFLICCLIVWMTVAVATDRILLKDVQSFVVREGAMTNARRSAAVPQLVCLNGPHCSKGPRSALCTNMGFDGTDVTWKCEAEMASGLRFDRIQVSCEGYGYADDPYILADSCGLEYTLQGTPTAPRSEPSPFPPGVLESMVKKAASTPPPVNPITSVAQGIIVFIFIIVLALIVFGCIFMGVNGAPSSPSYPRSPSGGGGGSGGPGFWSGLGIGALTGFSAASRTTTSSSPRVIVLKEKEEDVSAITERREESPRRSSRKEIGSIAYSDTKRRKESSAKEETPTSVAYSTTERREENPSSVVYRTSRKETPSIGYSDTKRREESSAKEETPTTSTAYSVTKKR